MASKLPDTGDKRETALDTVNDTVRDLHPDHVDPQRQLVDQNLRVALLPMALIAFLLVAFVAGAWTVLTAGGVTRVSGPVPSAASASGQPSGAATGSSVASPSTASLAASPSPIPTAVPLGFTPGTKASPRIVAITGDDVLNFTPGVLVIAEGETITFKISVTGKAEHEFKVGPADAVFADAETAPEVAGVMTGKPASLTYTFDGPGPFAFACHFPGHFEHGMKGYIIVVGPDVPVLGTKARPRLVRVDMNDQLKFLPDRVSVTKGETITFLLTNSGKVTHEFQVGLASGVAVDQVDGVTVIEADELDGGSTHAVTYTFDGVGPYAFACHEPGHFEHGMKGSIDLVGT